jgi:hypothetical protein
MRILFVAFAEHTEASGAPALEVNLCLEAGLPGETPEPAVIGTAAREFDAAWEAALAAPETDSRGVHVEGEDILAECPADPFDLNDRLWGRIPVARAKVLAKEAVGKADGWSKQLGGDWKFRGHLAYLEECDPPDEDEE